MDESTERKENNTMELSAVNAQTRFHLSLFKHIVPRAQCVNSIGPCQFYRGNCSSFNMVLASQKSVRERVKFKEHLTIKAVAAGLGDTQTTSQFNEFSVSTCPTDNTNELKISIEVSGMRTQAVFDDVFSKMVVDAQPIPGFRRVKGGKTPNIPKDILMEILGASKVNEQVIKKLINSTISEYAQKEGLSVAKELRVEQSFEELEAKFEPGDQFKFEAIIRCQD